MHSLRRLLPFLVAVLLPIPARGGAVRELFNGIGLDGWVAEGVKEYKDDKGKVHAVWSVRDKKLVCDGKGFGFLRYAKQEFADFEFHVEYRFVGPSYNSGIGFRTRPFDPAQSWETRPSFYSYEIQLVNDAGKAPTPHSSGSLYRYVAPKVNAVKPAPEWNTVDVRCVGPHIRITINGKQVIDVDQSTIEQLKNKPLKGHVCLQNHGGQVEFRKVRIREIEPKSQQP